MWSVFTLGYLLGVLMALKLFSKGEEMIGKPAYKINTAINIEHNRKLTSWEVFSQLTRINFQKNKAGFTDAVKPAVRLAAGV